jgi:hypothetical protein
MIPKATVLSPRSCSYSNAIFDALGDELWVPTLALSLALSLELCAGPHVPLLYLCGFFSLTPYD